MTLPVVVVIVLAVLGMPLFACLAALGLFGLHHSESHLSGAVSEVYRLAGDQADALSTIPLFTFAGYLMASSKTAERLIRMANAILGWLPGGLAVMTVLTCAFFTTFTGASGVTIVAVGGLILPELERANYGRRFSVGAVTGSGAVGLLFPPALPIIVFGTVFGLTYGTAVRDLPDAVPFTTERFLFAGVVPGLVLVGLLCAYCVFEGWRTKVPTKAIDVRAFGKALWEAKWEVPIPILIIAGLKSGWVDPPQSAALTALYVFVIEVFVYRDIDIRKDLFKLTRESMTLVGAIFMKIIGATVLTNYLVLAEIPDTIFHALEPHLGGAAGFLLVMNLVLLLVGCLMDIFSAIIVVVPLIVPGVVHYHIDPYHAGVIFLLNLEIGYLLPPAGLNLFIAAFRFNRPITELYRAVVPFILIMLVALGLVTYVPKLTVVPAESRPAATGLAPSPVTP